MEAILEKLDKAESFSEIDPLKAIKFLEEIGNHLDL